MGASEAAQRRAKLALALDFELSLLPRLQQQLQQLQLQQRRRRLLLLLPLAPAASSPLDPAAYGTREPLLLTKRLRLPHLRPADERACSSCLWRRFVHTHAHTKAPARPPTNARSPP